MHVYRSLLFSRKGTGDRSNMPGMSNIPGWKLFGKIPAKMAPEKHPSNVSLEYAQTRRLDTGKSEPVNSSMKPMSNSAAVGGQVARRSSKEVPSTTALILEHRPELVSLSLFHVVIILIVIIIINK